MSGGELTDAERAAVAELRERLGAPLTLEQIAARLGLSREYVRQIERRALGKLERAARRAGLDRSMFET